METYNTKDFNSSLMCVNDDVNSYAEIMQCCKGEKLSVMRLGSQLIDVDFKIGFGSKVNQAILMMKQAGYDYNAIASKDKYIYVKDGED